MQNRREHSADIGLWLKIIRADGVGPITFRRLLEKFHTVDRIMGTSAAELVKVEGIGSKTAEMIVRSRDNFNSEKELCLAEKHGIWILHCKDKRYPAALKVVYDRPAVLYVKGTIERKDSLAVGIVGSRRCSHYGMEQASRFAHFLSSSGFTIVSGLARGVDTAAHRGAVSASGRTIAVQGCGLLKIFPPENKKLFEQISENGACISELPLEYEPIAENFPGRNRIIAGLSMGVIVAEAARRSGALLTAKAALEYERDVMAIPGRIDSPLSAGVNNLIKQGARLIDSIEEVMETLGYIGQGLKEHAVECSTVAEKRVQRQLFDMSQLSLNEPEQKVCNVLNSEPMHIEEIIDVSGLGAGKVNASLISLRLKGLIKDMPGNLYCRK